MQTPQQRKLLREVIAREHHLSEILSSLPKNWAWQLEQPRFKGLIKVEGKKRLQPAQYTVYISNDETFGTKKFVSVWVDGNDLKVSLIECIRQVLDKEEEIEKEINQKTG